MSLMIGQVGVVGPLVGIHTNYPIVLVTNLVMESSISTRPLEASIRMRMLRPMITF